MQTFRLFFFIFLFSIFGTGIINAQWESASPSGNPYIMSFEVSPDGSGGTYLFAGSSVSVVYRTSSHGQQWSSVTIASGFNIWVHSLMAVQDQSSGTILFAALTGTPKMRRSTDFGETWSDANIGLSGTGYGSLAIIDSVIFAGDEGVNTRKGVFKSTNYGSNWSQTALNNRYIYALATMGPNLLAGTYNFGFQFSSNNGTSWIEAGFTNENVYAIAVIDNNVFVSAQNSVFRTTDLGINWTPAGNNLPNNPVLAFATYENNLFASTQNFGVWLSTDFGGNWTNISEGFDPSYQANTLIVNEPYIFAGRRSRGVWRRLLSEVVTSVELTDDQIPNDFTLKQNYPNPFNPSTKIKFSVPQSSFVTIKVYSILGKEITTLISEKKAIGSYEVDFNAKNLPSGVYFYKLQAGSFIESKKMILLR